MVRVFVPATEDALKRIFVRKKAGLRPGGRKRRI
jgi:hypothetical protein